MECLEIKNNYSTPPRNIAWVPRHCPSWFFYFTVFVYVWRASVLSRKGLYTDERWVRSSQEVFQLLESTGIRFEVENFRVVAASDSPCVFISNHMSTLETFVTPGMIRPYRKLGFVLKDSLLRYPIIRHIMKSRDPVVVGRVNPREDLKTVLTGGAERLARGISIIVFPQTTRTTQFDPANFNSIGIKLARRAKVPVIPVALKTDAWSNGKIIKDFGKIHPERPVRFSFGQPLRIEGNGKAQHEAVLQFIAGKLASWKDEK